MAAPAVDRGPTSRWPAPDALVALAVLVVLVLAAAGAAIGLVVVLPLAVTLGVAVRLTWRRRRSSPWWQVRHQLTAELEAQRRRALASPGVLDPEASAALHRATGALAEARTTARALDRAALTRRPVADGRPDALALSHAEVAADLSLARARLDDHEAARAEALAAARRELAALDPPR